VFCVVRVWIWVGVHSGLLVMFMLAVRVGDFVGGGLGGG
jgi:putative Ca2+/H+ antiporter (TMEM165/GDT1 family)